MRGDHADYSGAPNRGCVRARAIFPCCDRDPDFTLSFERFLWSACLPSSLARDRPNRFPRTLVSPDAQEHGPNARSGLTARRHRWRALEFSEGGPPPRRFQRVSRVVGVRNPEHARGLGLASPSGTWHVLEACTGLKTVLARALKCPCHEIMHSAMCPVNHRFSSSADLEAN